MCVNIALHPQESTAKALKTQDPSQKKIATTKEKQFYPDILNRDTRVL